MNDCDGLTSQGIFTKFDAMLKGLFGYWLDKCMEVRVITRISKIKRHVINVDPLRVNMKLRQFDKSWTDLSFQSGLELNVGHGVGLVGCGSDPHSQYDTEVISL